MRLMEWLRNRNTHTYKEKTMEPNTTTHGANGAPTDKASPPPENGWLLTGRRETGVIDHEMLEVSKAIKADAGRVAANGAALAALGLEMHDAARDNDIQKNNTIEDLQDDIKGYTETIARQKAEIRGLKDEVTRLEAKDWFEEAAEQEERANKAEAAYDRMKSQLETVRRDFQDAHEQRMVDLVAPDPVEVPEPSDLRKERIATAKTTFNWDNPHHRNLKDHAKKFEKNLLKVATYDDDSVTTHKDLIKAMGIPKAPKTTVYLRLLGVVSRSLAGDGTKGHHPRAYVGIKLNGTDGKLPDGLEFAANHYKLLDHWLENIGDVIREPGATIHIKRIKEFTLITRKELIVDWLHERGFRVETTKGGAYTNVHGLKAKEEA